MSPKLVGAVIVAMAGALAAPMVTAGEVSKTVAFALDTWVPLGVKDGPVTLHRIRLAQQKGPLTESTLFRPGNSQFLDTVQIQLDYSNPEKPDWKAEPDVVWVDDAGNEIGGYGDAESLDAGESRETATVTLSTLEYGLAHGRKLKIALTFNPE